MDTIGLWGFETGFSEIYRKSTHTLESPNPTTLLAMNIRLIRVEGCNSRNLNSASHTLCVCVLILKEISNIKKGREGGRSRTRARLWPNTKSTCGSFSRCPLTDSCLSSLLLYYYYCCSCCWSNHIRGFVLRHSAAPRAQVASQLTVQVSHTQTHKHLNNAFMQINTFAYLLSPTPLLIRPQLPPS